MRKRIDFGVTHSFISKQLASFNISGPVNTAT
jgi:hypothetical protein